MRFAVLGQGSIGRRHARLLREVGHEVVAYDPSADSLEAVPGVGHAESEDAALDGAQAAIVASPTSEHLRQARLALERGLHVLVEKPLAPSAAGLGELERLSLARGLVLGVAMNWRFHPGIAGLRKLCEVGALGRILRAAAWCGSWLPGWRPDRDYRKSYSARRELGGGVLLDAIHEVDYLAWLVGPARSVTATLAHVSTLELDVEDVALLQLELAGGGVATVTLDYFDRAYNRGCRIVGDSGSAEWRWDEDAVRAYDSEGRLTTYPAPRDAAPTYLSELEDFLSAVERGEPTLTGVREACHALEIIDAARLSAREGRRVELGPVLREAAESDRDLLRDWRNDPTTQRWALEQHLITPEEHAEWFQRKIADPRCAIWIAEVDGLPVGHVRLEAEGDRAEVHITVAPAARGHGYASQILELAASEAPRRLGVSHLTAQVKPGNERSIRAFRRAGFAEASRGSGGILRFELPLRDAPR